MINDFDKSRFSESNPIILNKMYGIPSGMCDFCVSVGKTNFTDHHTPDTIKGFKDFVLVCKMHDCYCTIRENFEHFHSFSSGHLTLIKCQTIAMVRLYENKPLQNAFKSI